MKANFHFRQVPDRCFSRREDHALPVNRPVAKRREETPWKGQVRGSRIHQGRLSLGLPAIRRKHFDLDLKEPHTRPLFYVTRNPAVCERGERGEAISRLRPVPVRGPVPRMHFAALRTDRRRQCEGGASTASLQSPVY